MVVLHELLNSHPSASKVSILDVKHISEHSAQEICLVLVGSHKLGTSITFDEPEVKVVIEEEIKSEHLKHTRVLEVVALRHSDSVEVSFLELGSEVVVKPVLISDFSLRGISTHILQKSSYNFEEIILKVLHGPHLVVSHLGLVHSEELTLFSGNLE